jgi:CheY-like chemotaxis protein
MSYGGALGSSGPNSMTAIVHKYYSSNSFPDEGPQNVQIGFNRLHGHLRDLARLSELRLTSERADYAVFQGAHLLRAAVCTIQSVKGEIGDRSCVLHCESGVNPDDVRPVATELTARVARGGTTLIVKNLGELFPNQGWLHTSEVHSYLGVPIFGSNGSVSSVAAVFCGKNRLFDEEDGFWLSIAGQLVRDSMACEALSRELRTLKEQSYQSQGKGCITEDASPNRSRQPGILVVDDDRVVNDMLCQFLAMEGYQVEPAFNGREAMQAFNPAKHDLVITDLAMPVMNGLELIAALLSRTPSLPIILISGYASGYGIGELNQHSPSKLGVSAVLNKPLNLSEVAALVDSLVKISK